MLAQLIKHQIYHIYAIHGRGSSLSHFVGTETYFKSQLCVEDFSHRKPILILLNGLSKPGE